MNAIRVIELFAGIGAQASALERLGIPHERIGVAEFEPHAYAAYCAIHGDTPNFGDITKIEHLPPCDLLTYSPPCQDISIAGNKKGLKEGSGTRSSLFWEVLRLLRDMKARDCLPAVLQMENVDAIINKQNRPHLERFIIALNELGYDSSWQILNAKDFGVPQNRNRFYMISTLDKGLFQFPVGFPLEKRLKDVLEENVDESYYLRPEQIATYNAHLERQIENGRGFGWHPKRKNGGTERERVLQIPLPPRVTDTHPPSSSTTMNPNRKARGKLALSLQGNSDVPTSTSGTASTIPKESRPTSLQWTGGGGCRRLRR